jgi:hypothetical protein
VRACLIGFTFILGLLLQPLSDARSDPELPTWLSRPTQIKVGVGDRMAIQRRGRSVWLAGRARDLGLQLGLHQIWLPRGWRKDWAPNKDLERLAREGITPVLVHYFFGDDATRERLDELRDEWYSSLWELGKLARIDAPVLIILEPEFNNAAPQGQTALLDTPWFAEDLRAAAKMLRRQAPNVLVGVCPGDFSGPPRLEGVLGPVADDLDFIAFQEMRAVTVPAARGAEYLDVDGSAVDFARYLKRAFGRPILVGYVAVSSHGGWEEKQATVLRRLARRREALLEAGVFGFIYFQLYDDPKHRGYFGRAETSFGLLTANGGKKPAFDSLRDEPRFRTQLERMRTSIDEMRARVVREGWHRLDSIHHADPDPRS